MNLKPGVYGMLSLHLEVVSEEDLSPYPKVENIGWGMYGQNECEEVVPETETPEEARKRRIWEAIQAISTGG